MFSERVPRDLAPNRLAVALARARGEGRVVIDLTESNPTRAGFEYPADLLAGLADRESLVYQPQPAGLATAREAVAGDFQRRGLDVSPGRIVLTASTSEAYSLLFKVLCDAGDQVLAPRPSYPLFEHLTRLDGVVAEPYHLEYHGRWSVDFARFEESLAPRTRAVLLVNPNNPTGGVVAAAEIDRMADLCRASDIAIISDEVFADYELTAGAGRASGPLLGRRDVLGFTLGGLSKSIGLPQAKLAWIAVSGPESIVAQALARLEFAADAYLSVSTPVQMAAADLLNRGAAIRRQVVARVQANHRWLLARTERCPACRVLHSDGGWYAVMQVPTLTSEEDLVVALVERQGVLAHPGYFFDFPRESFLVLSLLPRPDAFAEGVNRVLRHFDCSATDI